MHNVPHWNCDSPDMREEGLRNKPLIPVFSRILSSNLEEWLYHSHGKTGNQCLVKIQGHNFLGVPLSTHSPLVATPPQPCSGRSRLLEPRIPDVTPSFPSTLPSDRVRARPAGMRETPPGLLCEQREVKWQP